MSLDVQPPVPPVVHRATDEPVGTALASTETAAPEIGSAAPLTPESRRTGELAAIHSRLGVDPATPVRKSLAGNLRRLVQDLKTRATDVTRHTVRAARAMGLTAIYGSSANDLRQLWDFAQYAVKEGHPDQVIAPIADVISYVIKYPEEATQIIQFIRNAPKETWQQRGPWHAAATSGPAIVYDPDTEPIHRQADVVVIGGGLSAASVVRGFAAEREAGHAVPEKILILERDSKHDREHSASLRNGGMLCSALDYVFGIEDAIGEKPIERIAEALQLPRAQAERVYHTLVGVMRETTSRIRVLLGEPDADVELSQEGALEVATTKQELEAFREAVEEAQAIGLAWEVVDADYMAETYSIKSSKVLGGLLFKDFGQIHPGKLVEELFAYTQKASPRTEMMWETELLGAVPDPDGGWLLETSRGTIQATEVIDARESFQPYTWQQARYSQIHLLDLPPDAGPMTLGNRSLNNGLSYMRKIGDDKFMVGSGDFPVGKGGSFGEPPAPLVSIALYAAAMFKRLFPETPFNVDKVWGGVFALSEDELPVAGELARGWHVLGSYGGTGLSFAPAAAGQAVADIQGRPASGDFCADHAFSPRRFFTLHLRQQLAERLSRLPGFEQVTTERVRIAIHDSGNEVIERDGDNVVFHVGVATLDAMNPEVALLFPAAGDAELRTRRQRCTAWTDRQIARVSRGRIRPASIPTRNNPSRRRAAAHAR